MTPDVFSIITDLEEFIRANESPDKLQSDDKQRRCRETTTPVYHSALELQLKLVCNPHKVTESRDRQLAERIKDRTGTLILFKLLS